MQKTILLAAIVVASTWHIVSAQITAADTVHAVSPTYTFLSGVIEFQFTTYTRAATSTDHILQLWRVHKREYFGVGIGPAIMTGPIVCGIYDTFGARAYVADYDGEGTDMARRSNTVSTIVNASSHGGSGFTMFVDTPVSFLEGKRGKWQRVIFAYGPMEWEGPDPICGEHEGRGTYDDGMINLYTGEVRMKRVNRRTFIAIPVILAIAVLWAIGAALLRNALIRPRIVTLLSVLSALLWLLCLVFYSVMRFLDHVEGGLFTAPARMFGDAAVFCFTTLLIPICRHIGVATIMGSAMERLLPFHVMVGIIVWIAITVHLIWFLVTVPISDFLGEGYRNSPVIGLICWGLDTIILVTSLLRRWFYMPFRVAHWLFLPTLVMACIHYWPLVIGLALPFVNYVVDKVLMMIGVIGTKPEITVANYHASSDIVELHIKQAPGSRMPVNGEYMLLNIPAVKSVVPHPFTVAWYDRETSVMRIYIKAMGDGSWTGKLAAGVVEGSVNTNSMVQIAGPYGSLQINMGRTPHAFLVSGGIGVTPMLNLLQTVADEPHIASLLSSIVVVWSLRSVELLRLLDPLFAQCQRTLPQVKLLAFVTGSEKYEKQEGDAFEVARSRPDYGELMRRFVPEGEEVTLYTCGPDPLMASARDAVNARPNSFLHSETFEF